MNSKSSIHNPPFDSAQDRPFDSAPSTKLRTGQDRPFDSAQDRPFDFAPSTKLRTGQGRQSAIRNPQVPHTVYVVDDDPSVQEVLSRLIKSVGLRVEVFASAEDFLKRYSSEECGCLLLDVQLPGLSGLDLQQSLAKLSYSLPIVFLTGHGDIPASVCAMKNGAVDFLAKPFDVHELLDTIAVALSRDKEARARWAETAEIRGRVKKLTPREREVMKLVITGMLNKQIGGELGISEKTVKVHRGRVMHKLGVRSVAELVGLCAKLEFGTPG